MDGSWIQADPLPGCLLVNVGDLLEAVSGGRYPATRHRVRVPEQELRRRTSRQSIVFFVHPDDEVVGPIYIHTYLHIYTYIYEQVVCEPLASLGPDPRYPPVTARQHLDNRVAAVFREEHSYR